ncbi:site-specific integrase [Streptococcus pneumoniae]|uniref:tyrosine-type recombinase/integrase n=1 Tax=Streptococcus pluranimalium TaxID=82348 RepID=UPI00136EB0E6|nr:tyrosine-type recombinase/integrase [Streptococcus pneumoniae]
MFYKQLSSGKYRYYEKYYDEREGKWKQVSITMVSKTRRVQAEARRLLEQKINDKQNQLIYNKDITFESVVFEWLSIRKEEIKVSTYHRQLVIVKQALAYFGSEKLRLVTNVKLQRYIMNNNWSSGYRRLHRAVLSLIFKYAVDIGYITENPIDKVVLPKNKKDVSALVRQREKFLTKEQMTDYLDYLENYGCNKRVNLLAEFLYLTGLRSGEALALEWDSVDELNRLIKVEQTLFVSRSVSEYLLVSPKTINSYREIYYNKRVAEILIELRELKQTDSNFVFQGKSGMPISLSTVNTYLKRTFEKSNIKKYDGFKLTSHVLRHSHISLLAEMQVPLKLIMERVGHGDEKTTLGIYTHVTNSMKDDFAKELEFITLTKN